MIIVSTVKLKNHSAAFNVVRYYSCIYYVVTVVDGGPLGVIILLPSLQLFTMKYYLIFLLLIIFKNATPLPLSNNKL